MKEKKSCCSGLSDLLSARIFRALGEPNRLRILTYLAENPDEMSVSKVAGCCPISVSVVSRHMAALRDAGILSAEKRGKEVFYRIKVKQLAEQLRKIADALENCCTETILENCEVQENDE